MEISLRELQQTFPYQGTVKAIYVRPAKFIDLQQVDQVNVSRQCGLEGDHYKSKTSRKRQVTLIQYEHINTIAALTNKPLLDPQVLRRNIVVAGINLLALKDKEFIIGSAVLKMTGLCHPCSRMEKTLGAGGYNAMRGHGGITATVVTDGIITQGDTVTAIR